MTKITRRTILAAAPVAMMATPSGAGITPRDPHPAWLAEWKENDRVWCDTPEDTPGEKALWARRRELEVLIATTTATTIAGVHAQLEWLIEDGADYWGADDHRHVAENACAALGRMLKTER